MHSGHRSLKEDKIQRFVETERKALISASPGAAGFFLYSIGSGMQLAVSFRGNAREAVPKKAGCMLESKYLRENPENIQKLMMLPPFKKYEAASLGPLVRLCKIREYEPEERIIEEGAGDRWVYFLLSGKVNVSKRGIPIASIDRIGSLFGELSILDGKKRSASVSAADRTTCLAVDTAATERLSSEEEREGLLMLLYRILSEFITVRLRKTTEELAQIKLRIGQGM